MFTLFNNYPTREDGLCKNAKFIRFRRIWILAGLAAIILSGSLFLPGCGSESKPGGMVSEKKEKESASAKKITPQMATPLVREIGKALGQTGQVTNLQEQFNGDVKVLPGVTKEEMDRRNTEAMKLANMPGREVMPGITKAELDRRNAEAVKIANSPGAEVMPGVTKEEMDRRNAEALKIAPPWYVERMREASKQAAAQAPPEPPFKPTER
jgi:hypothetical protein